MGCVHLSLYRRAYLRASRRWIHQYASSKVAASSQAAACLFGSRWQSDPTMSIVYCGLNFDSFATPVDRASVRRELGLAPNDFVIGHVGRFVPAKNHDFLLRIHAEALKTKPESHLLLIGEGPLEKPIRAAAMRLGTADKIRFAGSRPDVARLMLGAMNVFVMPSLFEGLGLAAVEAQAAGLPTILSDRIPAEANTHCGLAHFVRLEEPASEWASRLLQHTDDSRIRQADALALISQSHFDIRRNVEELCQLYS